MSEQTVLIDTYNYGSAVFGCKLRHPDTAAVLSPEATAGSVAKDADFGNRVIALFTMASVIPAGDYLVEFIVDGVSSSAYVTLTGTDGETVLARGERHAVLNTAEREAIASIIYDTLTTHPVLEDSYGELFQNIAAIGAATQTKASNILDGVGWLLADATGAIAAPQSATATAILTTFGSTYTVQYAGLTSTGVRTAPTLSKA